MRYRITNLSRAHDDNETGTVTCAADIDTVQAALEKAAANGERLYIRPVGQVTEAAG